MLKIRREAHQASRKQLLEEEHVVVIWKAVVADEFSEGEIVNVEVEVVFHSRVSLQRLGIGKNASARETARLFEDEPREEREQARPVGDVRAGNRREAVREAHVFEIGREVARLAQTKETRAFGDFDFDCVFLRV